MTKRFTVLLLTLLLTLGLCIPACSGAAPKPELSKANSKEAASQTEIANVSNVQQTPLELRGLLKEGSWEQTLYDLLLEGWREKRESIDISALNVEIDLQKDPNLNGIYEVGKMVVYDHPELFYAYSYVFYGHMASETVRRFTKIEFMYVQLDNLEAAAAQLDAAIEHALAQVKDVKDPVEQLLILHDYLITSCTYNWEAGTSKTPEPGSYIAKRLPWSAYGALVRGNAVCQGYTAAYRLLLNRLGIRNLTVASEEMNHIWNMVEINEKFYHIDVTQDEQFPDVDGRALHRYFLLSDETIREIDNGSSSQNGGHFGWDKRLPACSNKLYESGWTFNVSNHPFYRRNGAFYYLQNDGNQCIQIFKTSDLHKKGTLIHGSPGGFVYYGAVWVDNYVYFVPYRKSSVQYLRRCNLSNGKVARVGQFTFQPSASSDGIYGAEVDCIGLRRTSDGSGIEARSSNRRALLYRFP